MMNEPLPPPLTPEELAERTFMARRDAFIVAIAGLSLANGSQFSPWFDGAYLLFRNFAPSFFINSQVLIFYFTSLFLATFTVIIAGVPAALYERIAGRKTSDLTTMVIWLAAMIPLTVPALMAIVNR
jgi:hypothetical protein